MRHRTGLTTERRRKGNASGSDHRDHDVDVAAQSFGIGTGLVRGIGERLGDFAVQTGKADIQPRLEEIRARNRTEVHFSVDCRAGGQGNL